MLTSLSIKNYALINDLHVTFSEGLTIITGETGAGKSILMGGLSLVLGKRADLSVLHDHDSKCIIEAEFLIDRYNLNTFFKSQDLDYEALTIVRREILPSGKSRAFINDSPVTLDILKKLGDRLIDVHSQHQTLQLVEKRFQFQVLDAVAGTKKLSDSYTEHLATYSENKKKLEALFDFQKEADKEHDYNSFLLKELEQAQLEEGMQEQLEHTFEVLNNVEVIKESLLYASQLIDNDQMGLLAVLNDLKSALGKLSGYNDDFKNLFERIQSVAIEVDDVFDEIKRAEERAEANPEALEEINSKLQLLYNLQKKHHALNVTELLQIQEKLSEKVGVTANLEESIKELQLQLLEQEKNLDKLAFALHEKRKEAIPVLTDKLEQLLSGLGMPNASFQVRLAPTAAYLFNGKDELSFLFSANKGGAFGSLKKVASGGELSRIMLCIKAILADHEQLPTLMFDEIDSGVSGEVSNKMGDIMKSMSTTMQVFSITHLPQIAARGNHHFKVFKEDGDGKTVTKMRKLSEEERITEIAEMLGGKELSEAAIAHAKGLLAVS